MSDVIILCVPRKVRIEVLDAMVDVFSHRDFRVVPFVYCFVVLVSAILRHLGGSEDGAYRLEVEAVGRVRLLATGFIDDNRSIRGNTFC